jgi:hypothetical protein
VGALRVLLLLLLLLLVCRCGACVCGSSEGQYGSKQQQHGPGCLCLLR